MCDIQGCNGVPKYGRDGVPMRCYDHRSDFERLGQSKCNCGKLAIYGTTYGVTLRCGSCKLPDMVNVHTKRCAHSGCIRTPSYNKIGSRPRYCKHHMTDGMVNVTKGTCTHEGCGKAPHFNEPGQRRGIRCKTHKTAGMVNVRQPTCKHEGCNVQSSFGIAGSPALYCKRHKPDGMQNIRNATCLQEGCSTTPSFNEPGQRRGLYCVKHKAPGMIDVVSTICAHPSCIKRPSYNVVGAKRGLYCSKHRLPGMIYTVKAKCASPGCMVVPRFGLAGSRPMYCTAHKTEGMVNVTQSLCGHGDCTKKPSFGLAGSRPMYCAEHMTEGMVNVTITQCSECCTQAWYGDLGHKPSRCAIHKTPTMIPYPRKKCSNTECRNIATHHNGSNIRTHCDTHRVDGDVSIVPSVPLSARDKIKAVFNDAGFRETNLRFFGKGWAVIVEVDEHQGKLHHDLKDCERMVDIHEELNIPVVFVMYEYEGEPQTEAQRHATLVAWVRHYIMTKPERAISTHRLFYDGHSKKPR
jgi:hypothetical protein